MRLHVVTRAEVPCPVEAVWAYVVEGFFEHHGAWDPAVVGMERLTEGSIALGTRGRESRSFGGKQSAEFEVTEFDRPSVFGFRNTSGPFDLQRRYRFGETEAGTGTYVDFDFRMAPKGAMKLLFPVLRPVIGKQVRANIARIPALVTSATSSAPRRA